MRDILISLIKSFEGLRLKAYLCPAGIPTIGYGSTGKDIVLGLVWTQEQAEERLLKEVDICIYLATRYCPLLEGNEVAAIADFIYNLGIGRLKTSTLIKRLNRRDMVGAKRELLRWTHGGGRILPGLVKRRQAEALLLGNLI